LVNRQPVPLQLIVDVLTQKGYSMEKLSAEQFKQFLAAIVDEAHPLFVFKSVLSGGGFVTAGSSESGPKHDRTAMALTRLQLQAIPLVGAVEVARMVDFCLQTKLI